MSLSCVEISLRPLKIVRFLTNIAIVILMGLCYSESLLELRSLICSEKRTSGWLLDIRQFSCINLQVEMPSGTISMRNNSIKRGKNL